MENRDQKTRQMIGQSKSLTNSNQIINSELKTYEEIKTHGTQISKVNRENPMQLRAEIIGQIILSYQANPVGMQIAPELASTICEELIKDFYHLKVEEFPIVFANGMKGKYGKQYNQLGMATFFEWFNQYDASENATDHAGKKLADFRAIDVEIDYEDHKELLKAAKSKESNRERFGFADPEYVKYQKLLASQMMKDDE